MKTHFKFILCFVGILSITACGSSDPDLPGSGGTGGDDETLVTLAGDRSFSLLSLSAGKGLASGTYNIQPLAAFIQENNTDVVALQDVDFGTARTGKKNLIGEVAYRCSKDGQRRQGIFASTGREDGGETGVALFVRECFYGTNKVNLNDELVLLTAPYELGSGETVLIATCQFDKEDANKRVRQAEALAAYADQVKQNIVICASVYENESGNVFNILKKKYRRSCKFSSENTYPAVQPESRFDYVLTPLSQNWGTQAVQVKGDQTVSDHKALFLRIGLK